MARILEAQPKQPVQETEDKTDTVVATEATPSGDTIKTDTQQSASVEASRTDKTIVVGGKPDLSKYNSLPTTAAKIRAMFADGWTMGAISRSGLMTKNGDPIRFQHVRNTLKQAPMASQKVADGRQSTSSSEVETPTDAMKVA